VPDEPREPAECRAVRERFPDALDDPAVEEEILLHARGCLECMDAFLELKDTVKQLESAAGEIRDTGDFSSRVLDAIGREETAARRRKRALVFLGAGFAAGVGLTLAIVLSIRGNGLETDAGSREWPEAASAPPAPDPGPPELPDSGTGAGPGEEAKGAVEKPPAPDPVDDVFRSVLALEREPFDGPPGQKGRRTARMRALMQRIGSLDPEARDRLVRRLEQEAPAQSFGARRFREQLLERIKSKPRD
jgi:hypothetical protein